MLTAHLPSGYCLAKVSRLRGWTFAAALLGAVLPDVDILFFYFIDNRAIHHHRYWVHIPLFWAIVACVILPLAWRSSYRPVAITFFAAIAMHLVLDSISGGIMWLAPFNTELWKLFTVPPSQSYWIFSFVLHWTFSLEILIWAAALFFFLKSRRS